MYYDINRYPFCDKRPMLCPHRNSQKSKDFGPNPYVVDIEKATIENDNFRKVLWTGDNMQLTLMSLKPGENIGLERHGNLDQFIRIEQGNGIVRMGDRRNYLPFQRRVRDDDAILIPAGKWHDVVNTCRQPLKLYSLYAPPEHPPGAVHPAKRDAEKHHH